MKRSLKIGMILLFIGILSGLCSCRMEESYKKLVIQGITDNTGDDYYSSDKFNFAKVENIMIVPEIKEINHGEYIIYISAYSKRGTEKIKINKVILKEEDENILFYELNEEIQWEKKDDIYEGWITGGLFTDKEVEIANDKVYNLILEIRISANNQTVLEDINFEIVVKGYRSFVAPT